MLIPFLAFLHFFFFSFLSGSRGFALSDGGSASGVLQVATADVCVRVVGYAYVYCRVHSLGNYIFMFVVVLMYMCMFVYLLLFLVMFIGLCTCCCSTAKVDYSKELLSNGGVHVVAERRSCFCNCYV